jgi:hypothetical protein
MAQHSTQIVVAPIVISKARTTVFLKAGVVNSFRIFSLPYANHTISCYVRYSKVGAMCLARKHLGKKSINNQGDVYFEFYLPSGVTEVKGIYCQINRPNEDPFEFFIPAVLED